MTQELPETFACDDRRAAGEKLPKAQQPVDLALFAISVPSRPQSVRPSTAI